ncbi:type III PLP-dependent enzyme domain-containing protein [Ovoidimarina sediminis]|uniref:alanine racemase n=1 Tax=Ovoidimarina sediminis TaxID=3079856 RepID=UPI0029068FFC|nr:alanine racemase [Rhodophyticola sp. MJ-SS7]MDU8943234.1 alanine racemase [Rhodophyticola sp. MJ-SS7]
MSRHPAVWPDVPSHLRTAQPDHPVLYFLPARLQATARRFQKGFPGLVTYAVKANDNTAVVENLVAAGLTTFDVASPDEMLKVRSVSPRAVMHYNNPVRSMSEIRAAAGFGIRSYSIDDMGELEKLASVVPAEGTEISVRLKLPVKGGYYDFGSKFGAEPALAAALLKRAVALGFTPSMTFHPGTQCEDAEAWTAYISRCAAVAEEADVRLHRLNVGGGFPAHRNGVAPELEGIFDEIARAVRAAFGEAMPALVCEPGRAMVAEAFALCARVKARRPNGTLFLNDGIYGGMAEAGLIGSVDRLAVFAPDGSLREGLRFDAIVFGPTCDSLDMIKGTVSLPETIAEEDYILFDGMGAYSTATMTRFNGYGAFDFVTVDHRS